MILVVDDDPNVLRFLTEALSSDGHSVVKAHDGVEAFEHLQGSDCKLMLLDVQMPRINGIELLLAMTHDGINVPTIIMSGLQDIDEGVVRQFPGVVSFLRKPFSFEQLEDAVRGMLGDPEEAEAT